MNTQVSLWNEMNRFFDEFHGNREAQFSPPVDVEETENAYEVEVDLPGVPKDGVNIELDGDTLRIRGERKSESKGARYVERVRGKFERVLRVPQTVDRNAIAAKFENGVLRLSFPKAEIAKPRSIQIQAA